MDILLGIILPIFGIMAAGYGATFTPVFDDSARKGLAQFIFFFAIPVMLFDKLATAQLPSSINFGYLIAFYGSVFLTFAVSLPIFVKLAAVPWRNLILCGFGSIYGNVVLIGIPLVLASYGDAGAVPLFLLISFHTTIQYTFITVLIEGFASELNGAKAAPETSLAWRVLRSLATNPILIGILSGTAFNLSGLPMPRTIEQFTTLFGQAGIPCALFSLGASLAGFRLTGRMMLVSAMTLAKLVLMPALFYLIATVFFTIPPLYLATGLILAAMPAGVNTYLFAARYESCEREVAANVLLSTLLSLPVLAAVLYLADLIVLPA